MKTNIVVGITNPISGKILGLVLRTKMLSASQIAGFFKCNISRKNLLKTFIFCMRIKIEVFYKLILSFWVCVARDAQSTLNKFAYLCNIFRKSWEMNLIFYLQINSKVFYKLIVLLWVCIARHSQSTQNKFTISLQYLKENMKNEVEFFPADKCQRFLQSDTIILGVYSQPCPRYPN